MFMGVDREDLSSEVKQLTGDILKAVDSCAS